jgi:EAL domain-containing protein (putative c-di-GMP-specific phosphodiesterase class I)/ActR/RegA family two-component response regulator
MSRTRIIAVDDDRRILRILKHACERVGFEVHSVQDANFFESAFRAHEPELVFLDLNMRNIDGVELLRFIAEECPGTSIIVTSGVDQRMLNAARNLGTSLGLNMLEPIPKPLIVADIRQRLKLFTTQPNITPQQRTEAAIAQNLGSTIGEYKIELKYQPMVRLSTREVVCAEAQVCIHHPLEGPLHHSQFIPVTEKCGLLESLSILVLRTALEDLSSWSAARDDFQVAITLSQNLLLDAQFPIQVKDLLEQTSVPPQRLVFEIVERGEISDRGALASSLTQLSDMGICLSLNNFGSNITSLSHIYDFPYQTLKLDKHFAQHALKDENAAAMIRSSLDLARSVGLTVVAGGIQTEETMRWLGKLGCAVGQGTVISPAIVADQFNTWLAEYQLLVEQPEADSSLPGVVACSA